MSRRVRVEPAGPGHGAAGVGGKNRWIDDDLIFRLDSGVKWRDICEKGQFRKLVQIEGRFVTRLRYSRRLRPLFKAQAAKERP